MNATMPNTLTASLSHARQHWNRRTAEASQLPASKPVTEYTIAISRQRGARGSRVAEEVGQLLNWPVYDRKLVEHIAEQTDVRQSLVESVDEKRGSLIRESLEAFVGAPTISSTKYVHRLAQVLYSLASHGECVIVGRGAGFLLPPESTFRVALVAPRKTRIARIRRELQLSESDAAKHVKQVDGDRNVFVREHFHKNPSDIELYDLILNTGRLSERDCAEMIVDSLRRLQRS